MVESQDKGRRISLNRQAQKENDFFWLVMVLVEGFLLISYTVGIKRDLEAVNY